jgi:hypothetical protein
MHQELDVAAERASRIRDLFPNTIIQKEVVVAN